MFWNAIFSTQLTVSNTTWIAVVEQNEVVSELIMHIDDEGGSIHHTFLILALNISPREWTLVPSEEKARWAPRAEMDFW